MQVPKLPAELLTPIVSPPGFASFPAVFQPTLGMNNQPPMKYRLRVIFPQGTDLQELYNRETAILNAYVQMGVITAAQAAVIPRGLKDGATKAIEGYGPGTWYISTSAPEDKQPEILDKYGQPILKASDLYAGCMVRVAVRCYIPWSFPPPKLCYHLGAVLKVDEGTPFGGGQINAQEAFGQYLQAGGPPPAAPGQPGAIVATQLGLPAAVASAGLAQAAGITQQQPQPQYPPQQFQQPPAPQAAPPPMPNPQQYQQPPAPQQFQPHPGAAAPMHGVPPVQPQATAYPTAPQATPGQPPAQPQQQHAAPPPLPPPLPGQGWPPQ